MATLKRSSRRFVIALGLVAMVLTGSTSASARDDDAARMTIEATPATTMVGYLKLDGIAGESTSSANTNDLRGKILRITPMDD